MRLNLLVLIASSSLLFAGCATDTDGDGTPDAEDCEPEDASIHPGADDPSGDGIDSDCNGVDGVGEDADGDGVPASEDCDDANPNISPDRSDPFGDTVDTNCDGVDGEDRDGDGFPGNVPPDSLLYDRDDTEPAAHPGGTEQPGNGVDEDCDGFDYVDADGDGSPETQDCDDNDPTRSEVDADADGVSTCDDPADCDDTDPDVRPGGTEVLNNEADEDCDGNVDYDLDGDGTLSTEDCNDQNPNLNREDVDHDGVSTCDGDCDDHNAQVAPGKPEVCDGQDSDCDAGTTAEPGEADDDGDGYRACAGDCADDDADLNPAQAELCDGLDNDCSGSPDAPGEIDLDGDGYMVCEDDCNDLEYGVHPGAPELCDGLDDDCNGLADADEVGEVDLDGDSWRSCADCDDNEPAAHPGAQEACDGIDTDCNGFADFDVVAERDFDQDGVPGCADCDDFDANNRPGAVELCDGLDNDCNGVADFDPQHEQDLDGDGSPSCEDCDESDPLNGVGQPERCDGLDNDCNGLVDADPDGEQDFDGDGALSCEDCDESDPDRNPSAVEECDGVDNDCNGLTDAGNPGVDDQEVDSDSDGFRSCDGDCDDGDVFVSPIGFEVPGDGIDQDCDGSDQPLGDYRDGLALLLPFCNTADDLSTANSGSTFVGSVQLTNDRFDFSSAAADFGSGSYVEIPEPPGSDDTDELSLCLWAFDECSDQLRSCDLVNKMALGDTDPTTNSWSLEVDDLTQRPAFRVWTDQGEQVVHASSPLDLVAWSHVCVVVGGGEMTISIDGLESGSEPLLGTINDTDAPVRVGACGSAGDCLGRLWVGAIDDVRLWDRPLTEMEVDEAGAEHLDAPISYAPTTPLPSPALSDRAAVATSGYLYSVGGLDGGVASSSVQYAEVHDGGEVAEWNATNGLPVQLGSVGLAAFSGHLLALGGENASGPSSQVALAALNLDGSITNWDLLLPLPQPAAGLDVVVHDGRVYAACGDGAVGASVLYAEILAGPALGAWQSVPLSGTNSGCSLVSTGADLYMLGGAGDPTRLQRGLFTAGVLTGWEDLDPLPVAHEGGAALWTGNSLVMAGGGVANVFSGSVLPDGDVAGWCPAPSLPAPFRRFDLVGYFGAIWIVGGVDLSGTPNDAVYQGLDQLN